MSIHSLRDLTSCNITLLYSVDGRANNSIPVTSSRFPIEVQYTNPDGTVTTGISVQSHYIVSGTLNLPQLTDGPHSLTIYGLYFFPGSAQSIGMDNKTTTFFVNDRVPPTISDLSLENKMYNATTLPITFVTDEPTSWIGYCIDGKENVTIAGNTTLAELNNGQHSLIIFANDTAGNMASSKLVDFVVKSLPSTVASNTPTSILNSSSAQQSTIKPSQTASPTRLEETSETNSTVLLAFVSVITIVAVGIWFYFRKRKF